jgi:hypothetical protein
MFQLSMLYPYMTTKDTARLMQMPAELVKCAASRYNLKKTAWHYKPGTLRFNKEQQQFIRDNYLTINVNRLSIHLGSSETAVIGFLNREGLIIPPEIIQQRKLDSRIKKGHVPLNKGKKQSEYMSAEAIARTAATRFKKGQKSHTELYDGAIQIRHDHPDRKGRRYKWIRISKGKWKMLHVYNWEQKLGPVPAGKIVAFKTKDTMNCELDNLELITREENMKRNTIHRYPVPLKKSIRALHKLNKTITKYGKKQNQ